MNPQGVPLPSVPDPSKADPKDLMEQIRTLSQQVIRERQEATRLLQGERAKCKAEMDKLRQTTYQHGRDLESQNSALLQSLGRLKEENDDLKKQLLTLQLRGSNGAEIPRSQAQPIDPSATMPVLPQTPSLGGEEIPTQPRS